MGMKNVWDLQPGEVAVIDDKKYVFKCDFMKNMPTLGRVPNRELVNISDPKDTLLFYRGIEVEVISK